MPVTTEEMNGDVTVVKFKEAKILSDVVIAQAGRELIEIAKNSDKLLLNFEGVEFMSSAMIGKIVLLNKKCKTDKVKLKLCNISENIMEVFEITRLHTALDIVDTEDNAVSAFEKKGFFGLGR